jgi:hypothetical protein
MARGDTRLRITWSVEDVDTQARRERHKARIEVLAGERAGDIVADVLDMTAWTPQSWRAALERSPFDLAATYDGDHPDRPQVDPETAGPLLWHELVRGPAARARPR